MEIPHTGPSFSSPSRRFRSCRVCAYRACECTESNSHIVGPKTMFRTKKIFCSYRSLAYREPTYKNTSSNIVKSVNVPLSFSIIIYQKYMQRTVKIHTFFWKMCEFFQIMANTKINFRYPNYFKRRYQLIAQQKARSQISLVDASDMRSWDAQRWAERNK